jgi:hypothetical protein
LDKEERKYYNPSYTAQPIMAAAGGGLMASPLMGNDMYPQSQQEHTNFATPTQMPTSAEVVASDYDAMTSPYTGQEMPHMADGGSTNQYTYDPKNQKYAEVPPPAAPVTPAANYGIWNPIVSQMNAQQAGIGDQWGSAMGQFMPGFSPGVAGAQSNLLNQQPNGGMGNPFSWFVNNMGQQAMEAQQSQPQYKYDPANQRYTQMAEGGGVNTEKDITSGYQGYGQPEATGRNPLELIKALSDQQQQQDANKTTSTTVVVVRGTVVVVLATVVVVLGTVVVASGSVVVVVVVAGGRVVVDVVVVVGSGLTQFPVGGEPAESRLTAT